MMIGILVLFAFIFILVLAFSSTNKQTTVRRIDPETGQQTVEIHESNQPSAAQTAARGVLWFIGIIIFLVFILLFH